MNAYDLPLVVLLWIVDAAVILGALALASVVALFLFRSIQRHSAPHVNPPSDPSSLGVEDEH